MLVDGDLDLSDEYQAAFDAHVALNPDLFTARTPTGLLADYFPAGPAILAAPFYAGALALHPDGRPIFGPPFTTAFALASLFYGLLALALTYRLCRLVEPAEAGAGVAAAALATPLAYYLVYAPSYSHTFSAFAVALFLWTWWRGRERRGVLGWLWLGFLGGLMGLVRFQDGPLAAIALLDLPRARWRVLLALPGLLAGFAPQVALDVLMFGTWLPQRPAGQDLQLMPGHYWQVLFSSYHGLFVWSPVLVVAVAGLALVRARELQLAFGYALLVEVVIDGAAPDWWGGYAFGARRFLDLTPFFALGLAGAARRVGPVVADVGLGVFAGWNVVLMANLTYVQRSDHDPGYGGLLSGQLAALPHLPNLFAQGAAARDLVLWPLLHRPPAPEAGFALLAAETAAVLVALAAARVELGRLDSG